VTFTTTGVDSRGGVVTCSAPQTYSGPDVSHIAIVGTCTDAGGKTQSSSTFDLRYDATAPVVTVDAGRPADHNGWFNSPVTFSTHGSDALSGLVGCSVPVTYLAPDTTAGTQRGSCTDGAGNTGSALAQFKFDATAPTVTAALARTADHGGWYNHPVDTAFTGTDATSGGVSCAVASYSGPDSATATVSSSCSDAAGNSASASVPFAYDATAPTAATTLGRAPDSGPWFNHAVSVSFNGTDALSKAVTCDPAASYSGPDSATASVTGTCTDAAGNTGSATQSFAYDGTAPSVTVTAARPPDAGDAYVSPVTFDVTGTDATSGGVTCDGPITYSGPDSATATVTGNCRDAAGNTGTNSATFGYQTPNASPPDTSLVSTPETLTNQTSAQFVFVSSKSPSTFQCSLDGAPATACTSPDSFSGVADGRHTFSVAATDSSGIVDASPATYAWTVDTVVPDTTFSSTPPDPNNAAASFTMQTDSDSTLACSLDNATFTACTSPVSIPLSSLPDGQHTFRARGIDGAGNVDATPASFTWTTDTVPPTVTLTATPLAIDTSTTATFRWTTSESGAFSCSVDTTTLASCGSGTSGTKAFTGLVQGSHTFRIRARDAAGNSSLTATFTWMVDTGPPDTTIDQASKPANPTAATSANFRFTATESSTFKCKLDNAAAFTTCTSPQSYTGLADGSHTFAVAAVDTVGNVDPTPATYSWLVDNTSPTGSITTPTEGATVSGNTQQVTAVAADNVSVLSVQFKLDGADLGTPVTAAPYTVTWDTTITAAGPHTLTAVITDEVGNVTTTTPVHVTVQNAAAAPAP